MANGNFCVLHNLTPLEFLWPGYVFVVNQSLCSVCWLTQGVHLITFYFYVKLYVVV